MLDYVKNIFWVLVLGFSLCSNTYASTTKEIMEDEMEINPFAVSFNYGTPESKYEIPEKEKAIMNDRRFFLRGIALFAMNEPVSKTIQQLTGSQWSHVGMLVSDTKGDFFCVESKGAAGDILFKKEMPRVQIAEWREVVDGYKGYVGTRMFNFLNGVPEMTNIIQKYLGTPYENNLDTLVNAVSRANSSLLSTGKKSQECRINSLFCSEFVAVSLMEAGVLAGQQQRSQDNYMPKDFSDKEFLVFNGASLSKEKIIKQEYFPCCAIL